MGERLQLPLPMWRAQFQILGGARRALVVLAVQVGLLLGATLLFGRLFSESGFAPVATQIINVLLAIQAALLVLHGSNAVHRPLLRDYQTRMFESHRLTPMSNHTVVLGYLIGGGGHSLMMFGVNVVYGTIICFLGQQPPGLWLLGNAMFLAGALPLWALMILCGLRLGKPTSPAVILLTVGLIAGPFFMILPVAGLVTSFFTILLGFFVGVGKMSVNDPALPICGAVSLFLAGFWLHLAALKYRRPDLPVMNGYRGLFLLVIWLALGVGSVLAAQGFARGSWGGSSTNTDMVQALWIITFCAALLVAIIPISGCIECRRLAREGRALRDRSDRMSSLAVALLAGVLVCATLAGLRLTIWDSRMAAAPSADWLVFAYTLLACVFALLAVRGIWIIVQPKTATAHTLLVLLVAALWGAPVAWESIRFEALGHNQSMWGGCSPCGSLQALWRSGTVAPLWPGLLVQVLMALLLTWLAHRAEQTRQARTRSASTASATS